MPLITEEGQEQGSYLPTVVHYGSNGEDDAAWLDRALHPEDYPMAYSQIPPVCMREPYLEILEEPCKLMRFRVDNPSIVGGRRKDVFPTVRIANYDRYCLLVASLVTNEEPHRPHPHELWMSKTKVRGKQKGIYLSQKAPRHAIDGNQVFVIDDMRLFSVNRQQQLKYVKESLQTREKLGIDPFRTDDFNENAIKDQMDEARICFEAYIVESGKLVRLLPVLSDPIRNIGARKVQREIGGGDVKLVKIVPAVVTTLPTFGIALIADTKCLNDRYRICFEVEGKIHRQLVDKKDIHENAAIGIDCCYMTIPLVKRTRGKVYLSRLLKGETEEQCSNELPIEFDPPEVGMFEQVNSGKRERRSSEGYSLDNHLDSLLPEGSQSFKRMALGDSQPYDLECSNDEGLSFLRTMKDTTKDDDEVFG